MLVACRDVEYADLVCSLCRVLRCEGNRVTGIREVDELHTLDDSVACNVEARDDSSTQH